MNTHQLQCFVCVADKLNFTKAAEELYLSTPTVTHHIKNLEEELNVKLFFRNSKMVKLTEAGSIFYSDAKDILNKIEVSQKRARKIATQHMAFLRIGCSSNAELDKFQTILSDLQNIYPHVYPQIIVGDYFYLKNLFHNKQLDIMLATKEMVKDMPDCTFKKLKEIQIYAVMSQKSLFANDKHLTFEDLKEFCLITLHPKFIPFQYGNQLQEKIVIHSQTHLNIVCEQDQSGILLAQSGYGVAIMPEFCIPSHNKNLNLQPIDETCIDYGIAYQKKIKESHLRYFIDHFDLPVNIDLQK